MKEAPGCHSVELGNRLSKGQVTGSQLLVQRTEGGGSGCDTSSWLLGSISHLPIIFKLFLPESPGVKLNPGQDLSGPVWSSHSMFSSLPRSSYPCLLSASLLPQGLCTRWSLCLECLFFFFFHFHLVNSLISLPYGKPPLILLHPGLGQDTQFYIPMESCTTSSPSLGLCIYLGSYLIKACLTAQLEVP